MSDQPPVAGVKMSAEDLIEASHNGTLAETVSNAEAAAHACDPTDHTAPSARPHIHRCQRCSFDLYDDAGEEAAMVRPDEEDVKEYLRRLLGGEVFTKTYNLFGGDIGVTFRSLSSKQSKQLEEDLSNIPLGEGATVRARMYSIKMLYSLSSMTAPGPGAFSMPEKGANLQDLYDERFGDMDEWLVASLVASYGVFERMMSLLMKEALSENFWKGAGLS